MEGGTGLRVAGVPEFRKGHAQRYLHHWGAEVLGRQEALPAEVDRHTPLTALARRQADVLSLTIRLPVEITSYYAIISRSYHHAAVSACASVLNAFIITKTFVTKARQFMPTVPSAYAKRARIQ